MLMNETRKIGRRVMLELHGTSSNRDAIVARISVSANGRTQVIEICGGDGFFSSNERRRIVGLGSASKIEKIDISWPSGLREQWSNLPVDSSLTFIEGHAPYVGSFEELSY